MFSLFTSSSASIAPFTKRVSIPSFFKLSANLSRVVFSVFALKKTGAWWFIAMASVSHSAFPNSALQKSQSQSG